MLESPQPTALRHLARNEATFPRKSKSSTLATWAKIQTSSSWLRRTWTFRSCHFFKITRTRLKSLTQAVTSHRVQREVSMASSKASTFSRSIFHKRAKIWKSPWSNSQLILRSRLSSIMPPNMVHTCRLVILMTAFRTTLSL